MASSRSLRLLLSLVSLALPAIPQAQTDRQSPASRPKIGLALSGGSAFGLSHLGVIRWFEEHRIPIDYIAGTSMGSIVGALYATGNDSAEMRDYVEHIDWKGVLSPTVPFRDLSFRRKEDAREFPSTIEFGVKKGIKLPPALSAGNGVNLVISRFAAPYSDLNSFDDLPTPFRCVATDLVKGDEVVFSSGPLLEALRASMALPALFTPVHDHERVLVDGGLLNNIPVDLVRKMGADVVIAVALDKPIDPAQLNSLLGIASRSLSVMITANERRSLGHADIVLMPNLTDLDSSDYLKANEFNGRGYSAAEAKRRILEPFALSEADYQAFQNQRAGKRRPQTIKPQFVEVEGGLAPRRKEAFVRAISTNPDEPIDRGLLEGELTKIVGMGRYDSATYSFVERGGREGLLINVHEKQYGPPFLKIGFLLDASRQEGFRFGIGGRFTFLDFGGPASEWRSDLSIGQINRVQTEYYYRLRGGKWFIAPRLYYLEDSRPLYQGDQQVSDFITRQTGGNVDYGYAFGRFQEARVGFTLSHDHLAVTKGVNAFAPLDGRSSDIHARWGYEGQNSALVPTKGIRAVVRTAWVLDHPGVDNQYPIADAEFGYSRPLAPKYSLLTRFSGGSTVNEEALNTQFAMGGVGSLDALGRARLLGTHYYYGGAHVLRSLASESLSLFGHFYLFGAGEVGKAWYTRVSSLPRYSGSLGLMGETAFGVVYFGAGVGDRGDHRFFLRLGRVF